MPIASTLQVSSNRILRVRRDQESETTYSEPVSNFSIELVGTVQVASKVGGPGQLLKLRRYPDNIERTLFCSMKDISTLKSFLITVNEQFPDGSLFLLISDQELKKLLMDMSSTMFEANTGTAKFNAARIIGKNENPNGSPVWVFSESVQVSSSGSLVTPEVSSFVWLQRIVNGSNVLIQESLHCTISSPLDSGAALHKLCASIRRFMPENILPAAASIAAVMMGASYTGVLDTFGCCGVPVLRGPVGACKSEASKCALSIYGAQSTHTFNSQTTSSYLFKAASVTTIPIVVDDVSERSADSWEELIIDAYNGTGRGTRQYNVKKFITLPILSANWSLNADRPRAHRSIHIPFVQHEDEPNASALFDDMCRSRAEASRSVGVLITMSQRFEDPEGEAKKYIKEHISPVVASILARYDSCARFITTHSVFMFFFLEVRMIPSRCGNKCRSCSLLMLLHVLIAAQ